MNTSRQISLSRLLTARLDCAPGASLIDARKEAQFHANNLKIPVSFELKGEWHTIQPADLPASVPLGTREEYEADVAAAEAAYKANPSGMNAEDLQAARSALKRHYPRSTGP